MPTELEITAARVAILKLVPVGYGMTRDEANEYATAALIAAEKIRASDQSKPNHGSNPTGWGEWEMSGND